MSDPHNLTVLMVGPSRAARGGIASVIGGYFDAGFPPGVNVGHVVTSVDGSLADRALIAGRGLVTTTSALRTTDVVHVHTSSGSSFARKALVLIAARAAGVPRVMHVHGSDFDVFANGRAKSLVRTALTGADAVVALSPQWKDALLSVAPRANVVVIPNGVPVPLQTSDPRNGPLVSFGRVGRRKGSFDIVRAIAELADPNVRVVIGGDGEIEAARDEARRLGVEDRVVFLGWIEPDGRDALLRQASGFLLPSHAEGLPVALLEAMAYGLPVIATPVGGIPEVVKDRQSGLLVAPGDIKALAGAIGTLARDPALRMEMGHQGRAFVTEHFSVQSTQRELLELWRAVARNSLDSVRSQTSRRSARSPRRTVAAPRHQKSSH